MKLKTLRALIIGQILLTVREQLPLVPSTFCSGCFVLYLSSQPSLLDLGDVGVCGGKCVKIHFVELIVELLSELPRQVVMTETQESKTSLRNMGRTGTKSCRQFRFLHKSSRTFTAAVAQWQTTLHN